MGEGCDNGNVVAGDGCGATCVVEIGYTCQGVFGGKSTCQKTSETQAVCGNSIYEPNASADPTAVSNNYLYNGQYYTVQAIQEQCDNGNQPGCIGCRVQNGWSCTSVVGQASVCSANVVTPTCGNGIYEPTLGESCDDGNIANGDGCDWSCRVENGWVCPSGKKCINYMSLANRPQLVALFCGNGKLEAQYGEECDDSNKASNDGCSSACKIESGWNWLSNVSGGSLIIFEHDQYSISVQ